MEFTSDESEFFRISPAAAEIFTHAHEDPELFNVPWVFDKGYVAYGGHSTYAVFWFGALSGWGKDELTVSASRNEDGTWHIKHTIKRSSL
ncbi:MAG: hypothetical protein ABFD98_15900 [Syntrophobacteraceae bacterium]